MKSGRSNICPNCGAAISGNQAHCPYCGTLNPTGAEQAYMGRLSQIKNETSRLADGAQRDFRSGVRSSIGRIVKIIIGIVVVLGILYAIGSCVNSNSEQQEFQGFQAREAFRTQHFDELDRLYDAGDDAALSEYAWGLSEDPGFEALFTWKHADYLEAYNGWEGLQSAIRHLGDKDTTMEDYVWSTAVALQLAKLDGGDGLYSKELAPDEEKRAAKYRADGLQFLQDTLKMSKEEVEAFADGLKDEQGSILRDKLEQNLGERLKQLGVV